MADIKDVSRAIHSALEEIGVSGKLDVEMNGNHAVVPLGEPTGDGLDVQVVVHDEDVRQAA